MTFNTFLHFIIPLGSIIHLNKPSDYNKLANPKWVRLANDFAEQHSQIQEYSDLLTEYITYMFANQMTYLGPNSHTETTLKHYSLFPPKECYGFVAAMATIYDKIDNKTLDDTVYQALQQWLVDNQTNVKFTGKN